MPSWTDANFLDNMHKLFGFDADRTEKLVAHLEPDALIDLASAAADGDKVAAMRAALGGVLAEDKSLIKTDSHGKPLSNRPHYKSKDALLGIGRDKEHDTMTTLNDGLNEGVLGMTMMPDLSRLRALAGMTAGAEEAEVDQSEAPASGVSMALLPPPEDEMDDDGTGTSTDRVLGALDCVEQNLPGVTVADLKNIRSRINGILMKLSESTTTSMATRQRKV